MVEYSRKWESVNYEISRLKVPTGWIVFSWDAGRFAQCFVPDPNHRWLLKEEVQE